MRARNDSSGWSVGLMAKSAPCVLGVHSLFRFMIPLGTSTNCMRIGDAFSTAKAGVIASSTGKAKTAPVPRKKARRGIDFLVTTIAYPPHLKRVAVDDTKNNG